MKKFGLILATIIALSTASIAQTITTVAGGGTTGGGSYGGDGGPATGAAMAGAFGIAVDNSGSVFFTDYGNNRIRKIDASGIITTVAGTGVRGFSGDGGPATIAMLGLLAGIAIDGGGNVYFSDSARIRKIDGSGTITTFAGTGIFGYSGDGGPASAAQIGHVADILLDGAGQMYICEGSFATVRKIDATGIISTVAGSGTPGFSGDGGPATAAQINVPCGLAKDNIGNLYIADRNNNRIRKVDIAGTITTFAGTGIADYTGDGGPATAADIWWPDNISIDGNDNLYVGTHLNWVVRKINAGGTINTFAGTGVHGYSGDGGQARNATFRGSRYLELYGDGKLYVSDIGNHVIRLIHDDTPSFTASLETLTICGPTPINASLAVADADTGQELMWQLIAAPAHGSLATGYTALATGATVTPTGLTYMPVVGYDGADSFTMRVYDGMLADTVTVNLAVHATTPGTIAGPGTVCTGHTATFTSTSGGGAWSISGGVATISAAGLVTGMAEGTATVSYTISNPCTTASSTFPIYVADCSAGIATHNQPANGIMVYPNPSNGEFFIQLPEGRGTAVLCDMEGRLVKSINLHAKNAAEMQCGIPGIYLLTVTTADGVWKEKIVVIK